MAAQPVGGRLSGGEARKRAHENAQRPPRPRPQPLPVRVGNPNPVPIEITSLTVAVKPEPRGCSADQNFAVTPSALTPASPLSVPAGGSVDLPAAAAPTIALRGLSSNQNACRGATVSIAFSGEARG